jgi:hypothetical protein
LGFCGDCTSSDELHPDTINTITKKRIDKNENLFMTDYFIFPNYSEKTFLKNMNFIDF